ncbi:hypothetical protein WDW86_17180 [Bdellovibrionota bacterium FG-2]
MIFWVDEQISPDQTETTQLLKVILIPVSGSKATLDHSFGEVQG